MSVIKTVIIIKELNVSDTKLLQVNVTKTYNINMSA